MHLCWPACKLQRATTSEVQPKSVSVQIRRLQISCMGQDLISGIHRHVVQVWTGTGMFAVQLWYGIVPPYHLQFWINAPRGAQRGFFCFLSTEYFGQRDHSVSTLQTPPYKSEWIRSKEWVPCGRNAGWTSSDRELAAGWQAVCSLGRHEDNRAGRKTFWGLSQLVPFCLDHLLGRLFKPWPLSLEAHLKGCSTSLATCFQKLTVQEWRLGGLRLCRD